MIGLLISLVDFVLMDQAQALPDRTERSTFTKVDNSTIETPDGLKVKIVKGGIEKQKVGK